MIAVVVLLFLGIFFFWKKRTDGLLSFDLPIIFCLKFGISVVFLVIYSNYYGNGALTADAGAFMSESKILHDVFWQSKTDFFRFLFGFDNDLLVEKYLSKMDHWATGELNIMNDAQNVIRTNTLIYFVSKGNVIVHLVVFSFLTTIGVRELYLTFKRFVFVRDRLWLYGLAFIPSVAFWSASILKEPLMMLGLVLLIRVLFGSLSWKQSVIRLVIGTMLMLLFKPYILGFLLVAILVRWVAKKMVFTQQKILQYTFSIGVFLLVLIGVSSFSSVDQKLTNYISRKQFDFENVARGGVHAYSGTCFYFFEESQYDDIIFYDSTFLELKKPLLAQKLKLGSTEPMKPVYLFPIGEKWVNYYSTERCNSYVDVTAINNSTSQLIRNIPEAMINATLRPVLGDPGGELKYLNFLESIGLLVLLAWSLFRFPRFSKEQQDIFLFLIIFSVLVLLLIGWTTPVLGAIVRYRIPAYLGLFICSFIGTKKNVSYE